MPHRAHVGLVRRAGCLIRRWIAGEPFHDPWLAFRATDPGAIHIAAGTYGETFWPILMIIDAPRLTVLGGYNREFSKRSPGGVVPTRREGAAAKSCP